MLDSRAVQRCLSRLDKPADRNLKKFKGKSKNLHLGQNNYKAAEGDYSPSIQTTSGILCPVLSSPTEENTLTNWNKSKRKPLRGLEKKMHEEQPRQLCLFSLKLRQERNYHSQLLNRSLQRIQSQSPFKSAVQRDER